MGKAKAGITVKINGFDEMLKVLKDMGADVDKAAKKAIRASAPIVQSTLIEECKKANVPQDIISAIRTEYHDGLNVHEADVGWDKGAYDPRNPSIAYKAIFLNYGAVKGGKQKRRTRKGYNRGSVAGKNFIRKAKQKSNRLIKREQEKIFSEMKKDFGGGQ